MLGQSFDDVLMAAQAGAGWAFTRLYEDLAGVVTGYLRQQGATEPDDVASETFISAFGSLGSFEGDEQAFRSWLFTIAHHRLVDERRRESRRPSTTPLAEEHEPSDPDRADDAVMDREHWASLEQHLGVLTPLQRDVVLLRVVAGLSTAETADVVERSESAVRQLQHRGLRALEEALDGSAAWDGSVPADR